MRLEAAIISDILYLFVREISVLPVKRQAIVKSFACCNHVRRAEAKASRARGEEHKKFNFSPRARVALCTVFSFVLFPARESRFTLSSGRALPLAREYCFALSSLSPLFAQNTQKIRLFCRL